MGFGITARGTRDDLLFVRRDLGSVGELLTVCVAAADDPVVFAVGMMLWTSATPNANPS